MIDGKVAIIIVNWNGKDDTLDCLASLAELKYDNYEIVVVDNGSKDNSVNEIKRNYPRVTVLETGRNLGFAGGNNVGIRYALNDDAEFILLLNNDTIVDPLLLNEFLKTYGGTSAHTILGAKIYYYKEPKRIWYAGGKWVKEKFGFIHLGQGVLDDGVRYSSIDETEYICGCTLFTSASVFKTIGLLDEKYFLTFEETDFCFRARKNGIRSYLVPNAKVWHKISVSFGGENSSLFHYYLMRNKLLWAEKYLEFPDRMNMYTKLASDIIRSFIRGFIKIEKANGLPKIIIQNERKNINKIKNSQNRFSSVKQAQAYGFRDYIMRRFGECSPRTRMLIKGDS